MYIYENRLFGRFFKHCDFEWSTVNWPKNKVPWPAGTFILYQLQYELTLGSWDLFLGLCFVDFNRYNLPSFSEGKGAVGLALATAADSPLPLVITGVLSWSSSSVSEAANALRALGTEWLEGKKRQIDDQIQVGDQRRKRPTANSRKTTFFLAPKKILKKNRFWALKLFMDGKPLSIFEPKEKWSHIHNCRKEVQVFRLLPNSKLTWTPCTFFMGEINRFSIVQHLVFLFPSLSFT